jgi:hypothetical protein
MKEAPWLGHGANIKESLDNRQEERGADGYNLFAKTEVESIWIKETEPKRGHIPT